MEYLIKIIEIFMEIINNLSKQKYPAPPITNSNKKAEIKWIVIKKMKENILN